MLQQSKTDDRRPLWATEGRLAVADALLDQLYMLVLLCAQSHVRFSRDTASSIHDLRNTFVQATAGDSGAWFVRLAPMMADELWRVNRSDGFGDMVANINNHDSMVRMDVIRFAWLCRRRLSPVECVEQVLFNVGASHGGWEDDLGCLRGITRSRVRLMAVLGLRRPTFENGDRYGWGLDTHNPAGRYAILDRTLAELSDPDSEISRYVEAPKALMDFERGLVDRLLAQTTSIGYQAELEW